MRIWPVFAASMLVLGSSTLRADATARFKVTLTVNPSLPPPVETAFAAFRAAMPPERTIRHKGSKTLVTVLRSTIVWDSSDSSVILMDSATKHYAQGSLDDYLAPMEKRVAAQAAAQGSGTIVRVDTRNTGRTDSIQGFPAAEKEIEMSMTRAGGTGRLVMRRWIPADSDVRSNVVLWELAEASKARIQSLNPTEAFTRIFSADPSFSQSLGNLEREMEMSAMPLRSSIALYSGAVQTGPLIELSEELVEISGAPVDDSAFSVPAGYSTDNFANVEASMRTVTPQSGNSTAADSPAKVIVRANPEYTQTARDAKVQGSVKLAVTVGTDGTAHDIQVIQSLDPGLDQKAIECVQRWKWTPAMKAGVPVAAKAQVDITFRLL